MYSTQGWEMEQETTVTEVSTSNRTKLLKHAADLFHKWGMWAILFIAIGVYGGVTVSKGYYNSKMEECIKLQGLVFKDKIYNVTPKI